MGQLTNNYDYSIHYKIWHDESDEHAELMINNLKHELSRFLPSSVTGSILDIGCGMGFALMTLKKMGYTDLYGIDIDDEQIAACIRRGLAVEKVTDTIKYLSEHELSYNIIIMLDVLEHIPVDKQILMLRAIHRALFLGGRLIVKVPNANAQLAARWRYIDYTHQSSFTEHSLSFVLSNAGFKNIIIPADGNTLNRPSRRIWKANVRAQWRRYLIHWIWRQAFVEELGEIVTSSIPFTLNMYAQADKI